MGNPAPMLPACHIQAPSVHTFHVFAQRFDSVPSNREDNCRQSVLDGNVKELWMKLVTFDDGRVGRLTDTEEVVELGVATMREFFERDGRVPETGEVLRFADVKLRAPIVPKKFFHTAGNFREHHEDLARVDWSHPVNKGIVFFQNVDAIIGPEDAIVYPEALTNELDYELEMAIVIGKPGKFFTADEAADHIAGYLVFNDITARDIQRREMKSGVFSFSKAIDTFCPIGPYIVTADEVGDPHSLAMELRVNGDIRQKSSTSRMSVSIPQLVAYHSPQVYSAGDLITTGTIAGVAASTDDPFANYLKPGDVVEAEIERLGVLRNYVVSWQDAYGQAPPPAEQWM
jgi:2-keto-4-pentenoate hydratase/2-oxohepta-3-ene-1,7-dioic acid hydratase in catechol pathway